MKEHSTHGDDDLQGPAEEAQTLLAATTDVAGDKAAEARKRFSAAMEKGKKSWERVQNRAVEGAEAAADEVIREHAHQAIGVAFGVGAVLGYILSRRT